MSNTLSDMGAIYPPPESKWLKGADLKPLGRRYPAIIHNVSLEMLRNDRVVVIDLVSPQGHPWPKRWILNQTTNNTLIAIHGNNGELWIGKPIDVWSEMTKNPQTGQPVMGVRCGPSSSPATYPPPSNGSLTDMAAVAGLPPVIAGPPAWTPPQQQQHRSDVPPLVDDEIPF